MSVVKEVDKTQLRPGQRYTFYFSDVAYWNMFFSIRATFLGYGKGYGDVAKVNNMEYTYNYRHEVEKEANPNLVKNIPLSVITRITKYNIGPYIPGLKDKINNYLGGTKKSKTQKRKKVRRSRYSRRR